ncbi:hypothetical protein V1517DRAFT_320893 [Lipomyces orientalis]|uniref:Uncharacterized protein n=1 Tax=Lipomyces orientalis TaxID=1233043 RepID=A0ACC3TQA9_9ASCO
MHIQNQLNFGISTTSRVAGSHGAIKRGLTSSSGTLYLTWRKSYLTWRKSRLGIASCQESFLRISG